MAKSAYESRSLQAGADNGFRSMKRLEVPGGGGTPYNGLYGEAPPGRGTFFTLLVYKREGKSVI